MTNTSKAEKLIPQTNFKAEFFRNFRSLTQTCSKATVWDDFITLSACAIANQFEKMHAPKREEMYQRIVTKYTSDMLQHFISMFACAGMALEENPQQDFLGLVFEELELGCAGLGQFFTPYNVAQMMCASAFSSEMYAQELKEKGFYSVKNIADPACGSGVMLIAAANVLREHGIDYQPFALFFAQDINFSTAMMCYIQLSLLGCAGIVAVGDSLINADWDVNDENLWLTPMLFSNIWQLRTKWKILSDLIKGM